MWDNNKKTFKIMPKIYMGEYDGSNIFPTRLTTIIIYWLIFFRIMIANILVTIFLTIKKIEINKINLKIIRPPKKYFD